MKIFKCHKTSLNIKLNNFSSSINVSKYFLITLILWLPIKEWAPIANVMGRFGGLVAPLLVLLLIVTIIFEKGFEIKFGKIEKIFGIFLILTTISAGISIAVYNQWLPVLKDTVIIYELFFLYLLGKNLEINDFKFVIKIGLLEAVLVAFFGIWQFYTKTPVNDLWVIPGEVLRSRAFATFSSPNALASYLLTWLWLSGWIGFKGKKIWLISIIPLLLGMYFTYSRSILLALGVGGLTLLIINIRKIGKKVIIGSFVAGIASLIFFAQRILNIFNPNYILYTEEAGRLWAIKNVLYILPKHFFYGVGPGMYGGQTASELPSPVYLESIQHGFAATYLTDNQYLQILIQQGVFGLLSYLFLFWEISKKLFYRAKKSVVWGGAILAIWLGYSVQGFFENIWFIQATATIVWIIIGIGLKEEK